MHELTRRLRPVIGTLVLAALAACGGGGDDAADPDDNGGNGNNQAIACDTTLFQAGTVEQPSAAQLTAYAATYNGSEGSFGPNPGDPFVASGAATLVLAANGTFTYKGASYTASSVCIDKAAGALGKIMYVHAGNGHFDIADQDQGGDLGQAWGVSPVDGAMFRLGKKP